MARNVGVVVVLMLGGGVWILGTQLSQAQAPESPLPPPPTNLVGKALAADLGLELVSEQPPDCSDYVVVESPDAGYCLEGHVQPGLESWETGRRLAGIVPSELDRQIFQLSYQLSLVSPAQDSETFNSLAAQLQELLELRESGAVTSE